MLPRGFLGTPADILMDIVIVSLVAILPVLWFSFTRARSAQWATHKKTQVILGATLAVVVVLFETDMRLAGGIFEMTKASAYAGTSLLKASVYIHTLLSIATSVIWLWLTITSLRRFASPPVPGPFPNHRLWGRLGMIGMTLTGLTGIELYVVGFVF